MRPRRPHVIVAAACVLLGGCANPDAPAHHEPPSLITGSAGEPAAPPPPTAAAEAPSGALSTPREALARFAGEYVNWNYRTLAAAQQRLAGSAVGSARLGEQQAAAQTSRDQTLRRARVWNRGSVVTVSPALTEPGAWVIVTRERTGGAGEYAALPAGYHVTIAAATQVPGGWAVSRWEPQN